MPDRKLLCGFMVVRKPGKCYDLSDDSVLREDFSVVGNIWYGGVERWPWADVGIDYYAGTLPEHLRAYFKSIQDSNCDLEAAGIPVCKDLEKTTTLLTYSNRREPLNEIIAVYSPRLAEVKGVMRTCIPEVVFAGIDVVKLDEWSLLGEGYFVKPQLFAEFAPYINENGLFRLGAPTQSYVAAYFDAARSELVEPFDETSGHIEDVTVYRLTY